MDDITNSTDTSLSKLQQMLKDREAWHAAGHGAAKSQTQLSNRTTTQLLKKYQSTRKILHNRTKGVGLFLHLKNCAFPKGVGNPNSLRIMLTEYSFFTSMYYHYFINVCSFINRHPGKKITSHTPVLKVFTSWLIFFLLLFSMHIYRWFSTLTVN